MSKKFTLEKHSNDLTKTLQAIQNIETNEDFRRKFVLETNSGWYYIYPNNKRFNNEEEIVEALAPLGVKKEEIIFVQQWGWYHDVDELLFIEGENSEWFDIVPFQLSTNLKHLEGFKLYQWRPRITRVYKDYTFKLFDYEGDDIAVASSTSTQWHVKSILGIVEENVDKFGLRPNKDFKGFMPLTYNDIMSPYQPSGRSRNNYWRYLAQSSIDIISRVLGVCASDIDSWDKVREIITHPNKGKNTKAAETKANLLETVFCPMIQKIESPKKSFKQQQLAAAKAKNYHESNSPKVEDCFVRNGDWIIYKIGLGRKTYLYNVATKKKYVANDCNHGIGRMGILRLDDLTDHINPYYGCSDPYRTFFEGDYYSYSCKDIKVEFTDWQYEKFPLCLNENNEVISPAECFAGTIIPEFLEVEKDWKFTASRANSTDYSIREIQPVGTIGELGVKCRIPAFAFGLLFIPKENALLAEQLFKLKLNGLLSKLLLTPHSFEVEESSSTFCKINKDGTNLKTILGFPLDKLRIYDKALLKKCQDEYTFRFVHLTDFKELFGNDFNTVDQTTFEKFVNILSKTERYNSLSFPIEIQITSMLRNLGKSYKNIANLLEKVSVSTYQDYLRLRAQYVSYFEGAERAQQEKIYKVVPEKAKKFMYLRDRQIETYWGEPRFESASDQYNNLINKYSYTYTLLKPIYDDCRLIGCVLELDEGGWVQYMHDELQEFCNAHQSELQERGFTNSIQRLKKYEYKGKELSVIAPKEAKDLAIEGSTLHHCVGGFVNSVIKGSENVLFIRRNDNPTKPFFTMALDPAGNIEQIHGFANSSLTKDAQKANFEKSGQEVYNKTFDLIAFLKEWAKDKEGLVNASTIRECYGALCAH